MQTSLNPTEANLCPFCGGATVMFKEGKETITWKCIECNKKSFTLK